MKDGTTPLQKISDYTDVDVLCGRGGGTDDTKDASLGKETTPTSMKRAHAESAPSGNGEVAASLESHLATIKNHFQKMVEKDPKITADDVAMDGVGEHDGTDHPAYLASCNVRCCFQISYKDSQRRQKRNGTRRQRNALNRR